MTVKKYLGYHARSRIGYVITTTLICFLITFISLMDERGGEVTAKTDSLFYIPAIVISIVAILSAILEFAPFMNRRNMDAMYSLPIDRRSMYLVHYLTGFVSTLIAHGISFWLVFFFWLPHSEFFSLGYAFPLYFISLVCGYIMYATVVFLFTQGNTIADGCITFALGSFAPPTFIFAIEELFDLHTKFDISGLLFYWSPINIFTTTYQHVIDRDNYCVDYGNKIYVNYTLDDFFSQYETIVIIVFCLAIGIAATLGFFLTYHKKRVETLGEITTSWFSYRTMIPLFGYSLFAIVRISFFWCILLLTAMIVGYVIYRRTYRLKRSDLIVLGVYVIYCTFLIGL